MARSRRRALRDPVLVDPVAVDDEQESPRVSIFSVDASPVDVHVEGSVAVGAVAQGAPGPVAALFEGRYGLVVLSAILLVVFVVGLLVSRAH